MRKLSPQGGTLQSGQRIGAYRIIRQLGAGGMGQVYEAEHVALGARRALKVFSTESEHSEFLRKRFVAEGRILADLKHPRIVRVYDLVVDEDSGMAYFEMDLVLSPNGQPRTLADEQRDGVDEGKVAGWFKDICEGLAYIHSQGIVHRDMSLDNILIGPDGHAVITDFGIAKIIDDSYRRKIDVTVTMVAKDGSELRMGKGLYMAPELKEQGGKATFASDAYAVGVILFRLLSGSWYDVGTHLEDWLADFEYEWHPIIAQLCNADPEKRLGDGGIGVLSGTLRKRETNDDAKKNKNILGEVLYSLFKYLYLILSVVTVGALPVCTILSLWIKHINFKKALYKTIGLLFGWRAIVGLFWLILVSILPAGVGNIGWLLVSVVLFGTVSLALKYIKKANAEDGRTWRVFNFVQWVEIVILSAYPFLVAVHASAVRMTGKGPRISSGCLILYTVCWFVVLVWQSGLRSLVSNKIRWAYRIEMLLLSIATAAFLLAALCYMYHITGFQLPRILFVVSGAFVWGLYLLFPLSPILFPLGLSKCVRNCLVEGYGQFSVQTTLALKILYIGAVAFYLIVFLACLIHKSYEYFSN